MAEKGNGLDVQKLLAMLAQSKEKIEPLKDVKIEIINVSYIKKDGAVDVRPVRLFLPDKRKPLAPLVYVPHYEMPEDALEVREYLKEGWAVASCAEFKNEYNASIAHDDLVFNNAALYTLKNRTDIDSNRIAVVGGSAGGYSALMLNALQLGICCCVANGPICNLYFNFYQYFQTAIKYNLAAIAAMSEEERKDIPILLSKLPIPFLGAVTGSFAPVLQNFPNADDMESWEAVSPTALCENFCNPLYITSCTSDILVPVDQITKKFTYEKNGDTLPADFNCRLPSDIKGKLKFSLEERLPKHEVNLMCRPVVTDGSDVVYEFDESKQFQIFITDEGAPESYASHNKGTQTGKSVDVPYIKAMLEKTAAKTNILTTDKLKMLLEKYQGKSVLLPAHENTDNSVYGSLEVYRKEVLEQLRKWKNDNGVEALKDVFDKLVSQEKNDDFNAVMNEINKLI